MIKMKSNISMRVLSFLLAFIMVFSMLPLSVTQTEVFADSMGNATGGGLRMSGVEKNYEGAGDYVSALNDQWGYKVSVWFAPLIEGTENNPEYDWESMEQIGKNLYMRRNYLIDTNTKDYVWPAFWNTGNIITQSTKVDATNISNIYGEGAITAERYQSIYASVLGIDPNGTYTDAELESKYNALPIEDKEILGRMEFSYFPTSMYKDYSNSAIYRNLLFSNWVLFLYYVNDTAYAVDDFVNVDKVENQGLREMHDWLCRMFNMENPEKVSDKVADYWTEFKEVYKAEGGEDLVKIDDLNSAFISEKMGKGALNNESVWENIIKYLGPGTAFYKATLAMYNKSFNLSRDTGWNSSYADYVKKITNYNVMADLDDLQLPYTQAQKGGYTYNKTGVNRSAEYIKSYFLQPLVLNNLSYSIGNNTVKGMWGYWSVGDFFAGIKQEGKEQVKGQYKIYVEPVVFRKYNKKLGLGVLSWRDMMMEYQSKEGYFKNYYNFKSGTGACVNSLPTLAATLYSGLGLAYQDYSLWYDSNANGTREDTEYLGLSSGSFKETEILAAADDYEGAENIRLACILDNTLGVGVFTSPSLASYNLPPQILKTYVEIDSVDEHGNVTYRETDVVETSLKDGKFNIDKDGNITRVPIYEIIDGVEGGMAYLNDIVSIDKDFNIEEMSDAKWINTDLPTGIGVDLKLNAEDIAGYKFALITGSKLFVEDVQKMGHIVDSSDATKTMIKVVDMIYDTYESQTGLGYEEFALYSFPVVASYDPERDVIEIQEIVIGEKNVVAVEYQNYVDVMLGQIKDNKVQKVDIFDNLNGKVVDGSLIMGEMTEKEFAALSTPANNLILRYIIKPAASQINIIEKITLDANGNQVGNPVYISGGVKTLDINNGVVNIQDPELPSSLVFEGDPEVQGWVTNSQYPYITGLTDTLPQKSPNGLEGNTKVQITNYPEDPITHNLYVKWKVIEKIPDSAVQYEVPEWRLSKLWDAYSDVRATSGGMSLTLRNNDCTHTIYGYPYLRNSTVGNSWTGVWNYDVVNANGSISSNAGKELRVEDWLHAETKKSTTSSGYDTLSYSNPSTLVSLSTNLTGVKNTGDSGIKLASWLTDINRSTELKDNYNIDSSNIGTHSTIANHNYIKLDGDSVNKILSLGVKNKDTYINGYTRCYWDDCDCSDCKCLICFCGGYYHIGYSVSITPTTYLGSGSWWNSDYGVTYNNGSVTIEDMRFNRYTPNVTDTTKLFKSLNVNGIVEQGQKINSANGLTTLRYQLNDTLNIYPEIGMLFEDDDGNETLEWVVGDEVRKIKPIVYQTLEHKVYVVPKSNGTSVATDSRATTAANALAQQDLTAKGKQLIYKGAGVNTSFVLQRDASTKTTALLTVKTYALDIGNSTLKSVWNNSTYNPYATHSSLITNLKNDNKASITEKLQVDAKPYSSLDLDNAKKTSTSSGYKLVNYSSSTAVSNTLKVDSGNAICFEHKLIIRGGNLIGVNMQKLDETYQLLTITALQSVNESLYDAIVGMGLYSVAGKNSTLFKDFEHQKGDNLTEGTYATKLAESRRTKDNMNTPAVANIVSGKGWYSEDTTVLVIKEYTSNFEVPSTSVSDKLPMSITGLVTPTNKAQFFSSLGKGYTYLKYNLNFASPSVSGIGDIDVYFEFSSYPNDDLRFGQQGVDYIVPNVSITDTTRMN